MDWERVLASVRSEGAWRLCEHALVAAVAVYGIDRVRRVGLRSMLMKAAVGA